MNVLAVQNIHHKCDWENKHSKLLLTKNKCTQNKCTQYFNTILCVLKLTPPPVLV